MIICTVGSLAPNFLGQNTEAFPKIFHSIILDLLLIAIDVKLEFPLFAGLLQMSVRREVQDGHFQPSLLQALSPQEVLRDRHAQGVHPHGRGEGDQATEDRAEQVRCV